VGHGYDKLQWRLLSILSEHERTAPRSERFAGLDTLTLAQRVHSREPTRGELVSVRRALATLMRNGEVSHVGLRYEHRHHWMIRTVRKMRKGASDALE
jgi:hypothetical protein